jgi:hypothetical protein
MWLTPFARTSFSSSLCGAPFAAQSPSMHRHRGVKVNLVFDHVLDAIATPPLGQWTKGQWRLAMPRR